MNGILTGRKIKKPAARGVFVGALGFSGGAK
jgi:hypothetical protein